MTPNSRLIRGKAGEIAAVRYLVEQGYAIIQTNWRCRIGELDIVAMKKQTLVFIEVRTRSAHSLSMYGTPEESITQKKQLKLRKLAQVYIQQNKILMSAIRFDVVCVILNERNEPVSIQLTSEAF
jgi:putative endonuclease